MATMNKPAFHDPNWYQAVTDNWTSIETNLIDKNSFSSKGDLLAAKASGSPIRLAAGANEQLLTIDGSQPAGVRWAGSVGLPEADLASNIVYNRRWFSAAGLLPGTRHYETPATTALTPDWDNTAVPSTVVGTSRRWLGVPATQAVGWDLGGLKHRILFILSAFNACAGDRLVGASTTRPYTGDMTGSGYGGGLNGTGQYRLTNGSWTGISSTNLYALSQSGPYSVAMLFDNGNLRYFYRFGHSPWLEGTWFNDGTHTALRHCFVRTYGGGSLYLGPVSIYYDN
jgi:hypothetical protein